MQGEPEVVVSGRLRDPRRATRKGMDDDGRLTNDGCSGCGVSVDSEVGRMVANMPPECTIPGAGGEGGAMNTARVGLFSRRRDLDRDPVVQDGTRP